MFIKENRTIVSVLERVRQESIIILSPAYLKRKGKGKEKIIFFGFITGHARAGQIPPPIILRFSRTRALLRFAGLAPHAPLASSIFLLTTKVLVSVHC